jgi:hypothetical protein
MFKIGSIFLDVSEICKKLRIKYYSRFARLKHAQLLVNK